MGKLTRKLNKYSKEKIEIQEFLTTGDNPEKAFEKMVNSGVKCDGLVISAITQEALAEKELTAA